MFTGIITHMGRVASIAPGAGPQDVTTLTIASPLAADLGIGDSIAVSGTCLTVVSHTNDTFTVEAIPETLQKTTLGTLATEDAVNLEASLQPTTPMGGGFVTGHVDAVGTISAFLRDQEDARLVVRLPRDLLSFVAPKGSITFDGVNLTVVRVDDTAATCEVALIPHTLNVTTLGNRAVGDALNVEIDLLARYVQRALADSHQKK